MTNSSFAIYEHVTSDGWRAVFALLLLLHFLSSILNPTLLDVPPECASLYSLPMLAGFVPYGWYPQTRSMGWSPIHSRTYPQMTLLVLLLLACGDIHKNTLAPWTPVLSSACLNWGHQHCVKMSKSKYYHRASIEDGWICPKCVKESFPYHDVSTLYADACIQSSGVGSSESQCSISHCNTSSSVLKLLSTNARS